MKLESIDFHNLTFEKFHDVSEFSREVYFDRRNNTYLKVWDGHYFYSKYFELAYKAGFYQDISLLSEIITDDDKIVGYITHKGSPISYDTYSKEKLEVLINKVAKRCHEKSMVYLDFTSSMDNIVEFDGVYYLIDLEAVIPVNEVEQIKDVKETLYFNNLDYREKIHDLIPFDDCTVVRQHTKWDKEIKYGTANGRVFLEKEYLPTLSGKILFVGVNYYTEFYHRLVQPWDDGDMETLDVLKEHMQFGSPRKHYICNILDFNPDYKFDHVVFFGILGHADTWDIIKDNEDVNRVLDKLDSLVASGGDLLLGPATQTVSDEYWQSKFATLSNYNVLINKKIDINCIWQGKKK